ncbi:DUF1697 domain-containing protein [Pseudocolwellia agarivorans]|uniref:DUF1697 domain-containing protein n=1 Tax=Pseudocolwellia agarivorans TaxID=1911682 RepID=UPI000986BE9E|nr:DUF1697 domain-containing protein [Pseudocolwellia agarivorans]
MSIYISLLRGINVSGQKKVNMKELASLYQSLNLSQVSTYIQSGNVVFSCNNFTEEELAKNIENAIEKHFGFNVPVLVLSQQTLVNALKALPFKAISVAEQGSQVILSFLSNEVKTESIDALKSYLTVEEELVTGSKLVYLHCPKGYGKTKLSNTFLEKKLAVTATSRNLKTVVKLCEMAAEIA